MEIKRQAEQTSQSPKTDEICNRIYIIGSVASGKTTLARKLSHRYGIPWYELDHVIWERHKTGDIKRTEEQRDKIFRNILISEKWIIEDVMRPCFVRGLKMADLIILLDPPTRRKKWQAFFRWCKQKLRFEKSSYRPTVTMLKSMGQWVDDFEMNRKDFMQKLEPYRAKVITLRSIDEINLYF